MKPVYAVWLRNDFRINDNLAIQKAVEAAASDGGQIVMFFHLHPEFLQDIDLQYDYFFQTLRKFRNDCRSEGIKVELIKGPVQEAFHTLVSSYPELKAVFCLEDYTPFGRTRDEEVIRFLLKYNVQLFPLEGSHIIPPHKIKKSDGTPYQVFTPYFRNWNRHLKPSLANSRIDDLKEYYVNGKKGKTAADNYFEKELLPRCTQSWGGLGEKAAVNRLETFVEERLTHYHDNRDLPDYFGTSALSPFIKTGALSVRMVYHSVSSRIDEAGKGAETFLKELAWRDFYAMIYYFYPETKNQEYQEKYRNIFWNRDEELFTKWKDGNTGFPIVDAGMRQLNQTGWMHNRLRMITASFLTKDYLIDWRLGEEYFSRKLIDYDEASNVGGWQWAASVGTDAVPYFRVFNPARQSVRFDPHGSFIKKFVPELTEVPEKYIHTPEKMASEEAEITYPEPTVDHAVQRKKAIALFKGVEEE
ncbi:DNA photolyase family protein [Salipaludibacillus sp. CUR1]|uniref:cryptochrome/photolyase family protein n=1 Tax=Salipaludibacillus sp. CUR1 TaxID=2820003 RepID=UPI001E507DD7|nr:deoxyribodipyrimidine photo-lyase [Salipaludibacillus sp. CUR1]MCE7791658.1 DNA photolyase family protein [Salipaludibacillus sp. CUR1]